MNIEKGSMIQVAIDALKEKGSEMLDKQKAADADALYLRKLCNRIY